MPVTYVSIGAQFRASVADILIPGDQVLVVVPGANVTTSTPAYVTAKSQLQSIPPGSGLNRLMMIQSYRNIDSIGQDASPHVDSFSYNLEGGISPADELADELGSAQNFMNKVNALGKCAVFGPIRASIDNGNPAGIGNQAWMFNKPAGTQAQLNGLLNTGCGIAYQAQLLYTATKGGMNLTEQQTVDRVQAWINYALGVNPNTRGPVQFWVGRQTIQQIYQIANKMPWLHMLGIGGASQASQVRTIIENMVNREGGEPQMFNIEVKDANLTPPTTDYATLEDAKTAWEGYSAAKYTITEHPDPVPHEFTGVEVTTG